MSSREKDSSDFDLEQFIDLFDTALASDNPAVKRALKNLLMIATLVDSDLTPEQRVKGPLRRLVDDIKNLNSRLNDIEYRERGQYKTYPSTGGGGVGGGGFITTPYTVPMFPGPSISPGTGTGNWPPGTIIGNAVNTSSGYTLTSSTAVDDQYLSDKMEATELTSQKMKSMFDMLDRLDKK